MAQNFLSCDRDQDFLLAPSVKDWLPEDHLAWFVIEVVERLELSMIYGEYRSDGSGRPAHEPAMIVALIVYAYCVGERSSRKVERRCGVPPLFRTLDDSRPLARKDGVQRAQDPTRVPAGVPPRGGADAPRRPHPERARCEP